MGNLSESYTKLTMLAEKYGTDKLTHGYIDAYADYLPKQCRSLLEIGIAEGKSAEMWSEYYGQDTLDLHYLDLFLNPDFVSPRWCRNRGIVPHIGSQSDIKALSSIKNNFEVIIDDGSHNAQDMLISFKALFLNNMSSNGVYVVEDLHCCKDSFYWGGLILGYFDTILHMLEVYKEVGFITNPYFNEGESEVFSSLIGRIEISEDEKIAFIWRK